MAGADSLSASSVPEAPTAAQLAVADHDRAELPGVATQKMRQAAADLPVTVGLITSILESLYPVKTAESWDRVGLVCGDRSAPVSRVLYAVDPVAEVVDQAIKERADLLIVHHPLLLRGVHEVSTDGYKGELIHQLITAGCALYVAHTNADSARPGVSDALARVLGLQDLTPLAPAHDVAMSKVVVFAPTDHADTLIDTMAAAGAGAVGDYDRCSWATTGQTTFRPGVGSNPTVGSPGETTTLAETRIEMICPAGHTSRVVAAMRAVHPYEEPAFDLIPTTTIPSGQGLGRVGTLPQATTLEQFAMVVAKALPYTVQGVRVSGPKDAIISRVAVCGGAGDSMFDAVRAAGPDAYLTADLRHHPASEARETARGGAPYLIDVAHWASEWPWLHRCAEDVAANLVNRGVWVDYSVSMTRSDPWSFRIPSSGGLVR